MVCRWRLLVSRGLFRFLWTDRSVSSVAGHGASTFRSDSLSTTGLRLHRLEGVGGDLIGGGNQQPVVDAISVGVAQERVDGALGDG